MSKLLLPFILVGSLFGQEFRVVEDNWNWEIDKKAHYLSSFGLYYATYVLCEGFCTDSTHQNEYLVYDWDMRYIKDIIGKNMLVFLKMI